MIVLAVLLLILVVAVALFVVVTGSSETVLLQWDELNLEWQPSALVLFLLGAVTLLLAVLALGLIRSGTRRQVQRRRELKRLREVEKERAAAPATGSRADREPAHDTHHSDRHNSGEQRAADPEEHPVSPPPSRPGPDHTGARSTDRATDEQSSWYDSPPPDQQRP